MGCSLVVVSCLWHVDLRFFKPKHRPFRPNLLCDWATRDPYCLTWTNAFNPHPRTTKNPATFSRKDLIFLVSCLCNCHIEKKNAKKTQLQRESFNFLASFLTSDRHDETKHNTSICVRYSVYRIKSNSLGVTVDITEVLQQIKIILTRPLFLDNHRFYFLNEGTNLTVACITRCCWFYSCPDEDI